MGEFKNGKPNGYCEVEFIAGNSEYKGNIINNKAEGEGVFYKNNDKYYFDGKWKDSMPDVGNLTLEDDTNIDHIYFTDYMNGEGMIYYHDKREYSGISFH